MAPRKNTKAAKQAAIKFNDEQLLAVNANQGIYAILAGPGSGKTSVIVGRYTRLAQTTSPQEIISLTFTKEAATEMMKRSGVEKDAGTRPYGFLTFHSMALSFAQLERNLFPFHLAPFPLATETESVKFASEAIRKLGVDYKRFRQWMSEQKHNRISPAEALIRAENEGQWVEANMAKAYANYVGISQKNGKLDFDDLLVEMVSLLERSPEVRARWQYKWVQVDESQDADALQWRLVQLITQQHGNLFAVGDSNQCIYEWRSAHPDLFLKLHEMFPATKYLYLGQNFRSTPEIVGFCKEIAPLKNELIDRFRSSNGSGSPPYIIAYPTNQDEAEGVVAKIENMLSDDTALSCAILSRTNRGLRAFEDALASRGIRYHLLGKSGFWQQREVKDIMAYVQLVQAPWDSAVAAAIRAPFQPTRFIRKTELMVGLKALMDVNPGMSMVGALNNYRSPDVRQQNSITALSGFIHGLMALRNMPAKDVVKSVIERLGAVDYYTVEEETGAADNGPIENLTELINVASRFPSLREFLEYVQRIQAVSRMKKGVALSTVHQAKGKEWEHVFVTGVSEGNIPSKKGDPDEEARIFFVACSRPSTQLYITYSGTPSSFLSKEFRAPERGKPEPVVDWLDEFIGA